MTDTFKIIGGFLIIVISNILGHYFAPTSIFITPIIVPASVYLFVSIDTSKIVKALLAAFGLVLNDFLIKTYAGGTHDLEGLGWISLFAIPALIISTIVLTVFLIKDFKKTYISSIIGFILFATVVFSYANYFSNYGLTYQQSNSDSIIESKKRMNFILDYKILDTLFVSDIDTFWISEAWIEKEMLHHENLIKRIEPSNKLDLIVGLRHNASDWGYGDMPRYFLDNDSTHKKYIFHKDKSIYFEIDSIKDYYTIHLLWFGNDTFNIKISK